MCVLICGKRFLLKILFRMLNILESGLAGHSQAVLRRRLVFGYTLSLDVIRLHSDHQHQVAVHFYLLQAGELLELVLERLAEVVGQSGVHLHRIVEHRLYGDGVHVGADGCPGE